MGLGPIGAHDSGRHPTLHHRAYKRWIAKPFALSISALLWISAFACCSAFLTCWVRPLHPPYSPAGTANSTHLPCLLAFAHLSAFLACLLRPLSGPVRSTRFHEPRHSN